MKMAMTYKENLMFNFYRLKKIVNDIVKHNASDEIINYVKPFVDGIEYNGNDTALRVCSDYIFAYISLEEGNKNAVNKEEPVPYNLGYGYADLVWGDDADEFIRNLEATRDNEIRGCDGLDPTCEAFGALDDSWDKIPVFHTMPEPYIPYDYRGAEIKNSIMECPI